MVESWDVANDLPQLDVRDLMHDEREELVSLLASLTEDDWRRVAVGSWDVHAIALHLLGNDIGRIRNGWSGIREGSGAEMNYAALTEKIERDNEEWVRAARPTPAELMPQLLFASGKAVDASLIDVDLNAPGVPVGWTGSGLSPAWLDIAREYTERWMHHQQIRDAIGQPGLTDRRWMHPVLRAFLLSMPRAYDQVEAPEGTTVRIVVTGSAGGDWYLRREARRWRLIEDATSFAAEVRIPEELAWRLFVRLVPPDEALPLIQRTGPARLCEPACRAVAVMTSTA